MLRSINIAFARNNIHYNACGVTANGHILRLIEGACNRPNALPSGQLHRIRTSLTKAKSFEAVSARV